MLKKVKDKQHVKAQMKTCFKFFICVYKYIHRIHTSSIHLERLCSRLEFVSDAYSHSCHLVSSWKDGKRTRSWRNTILDSHCLIHVVKWLTEVEKLT